MGNREKTRQAIIDAAIDLFYHQGFVETKFSDISKEVGISQPAIYAHFKNKMDLLKNVSQHAAQVAREKIFNKINPKDKAEMRLKTYLLANLDFFKNNKELGHAIIALYFFSSSSDEVLEIFTLVQETTISQIENFLVQSQHEGVYNFKDTRTSASLIHSLMVGDCYKLIFSPSQAASRKITSAHWPAIQGLLAINS